MKKLFFDIETIPADESSREALQYLYDRKKIKNPDLVERFKVDAPLTQPDPNTFYTQDEKGFTDYKFIN